MDKSSADAYVYAKICGKISKTYSGKNIEKLYSVSSLSELYSLLFNEEIPAVPETLLAKQIEEKAENNFVKEYSSLLDCYDKIDDLLITLLHFYDYNNLKTIAAALCLHESQLPNVMELGKYSLLKYENWPDIAKITENTELSWYNKIPLLEEQQILDTKLDFQYLTNLWNCACRQDLSVREQTKKIIRNEIVFNNIVWALRLKVYYRFNDERIVDKLFFKEQKKSKGDLFAGEALKILKKDISNHEEWKNWKYCSSLNPVTEGVQWQIDPRWVESEFEKKMIKEYSSMFHKNSLTSLALVCYFKIKQNELNNIRRVTEGLRLGGD